MKKSKTLEEFVKNSLKKKSKRIKTKSFSSWLAERKAGTSLDDAMRSAAQKQRTALSTYGTRAERLRELELADSGYARYLTARANKELKATENATRVQANDKIADALRGYSNYVSSLEEAEGKLFDKTVKKITELGAINYEEAYKAAIAAGLSEDRAKEAARSGTDILINKVKADIAHDIVAKQLTERETYNYALSLGLSSVDARILAEYARKINEYVSTPKHGDGYLGTMKGATYKNLTQ